VRARAQTLISMCPRGQRGQPLPPPPYGHPWTMAEPPPPLQSVHVEYGRPQT